jgi:hypothetical protein
MFRFLAKYQGKINDTQSAGRLLMRAFSVAHAAIIRNYDCGGGGTRGTVNSWEIGTTTMFGGILVPLRSSKPVVSSPLPSVLPPPLSSSLPFSTHSTLVPEMKKWAFVFGNVGDCKAFVYSPVTRQLSDVTPEARVSNDATDCGGRLGPYIDGSKPDLRNFRVRFIPVVEGDLLIICTDGKKKIDRTRGIRSRFLMYFCTSLRRARQPGRGAFGSHAQGHGP